MNTDYRKYGQRNNDKPAMREAVITKEEETVKPPREPRDGIVSTPYRLNVREEPNSNSDILATLDPYSKILVEQTKDNWSLIYTEAGIKGYVMSKYIKIGG